MLGARIRSLLLSCLVCGIVAACDRAGALADADSSDIAAAVSAPATANLPGGVSAEVAEEGRKLFLPCAVCHGLDGKGNQLGPSLRDSEWTRISGSIEEIEAVIRTGVAQPENYPVPMAPMGGGDFDAEELRAVASYVYAISQSTPTPAQ